MTNKDALEVVLDLARVQFWGEGGVEREWENNEGVIIDEALTQMEDYMSK